ncbi:MAG: hypothetical protein J2P45_32695 [Candidatus Dormibacteraeota bacterium]|nr:hypothetical protein [Candidatus Dormibacteraeota bacterium]
MLNEAKEPLADDVHRFIEDLGRYFSQWGMYPTVGRIWGYLMLSSEPVSLDQIAADLQISKSGASVATRQLESYQFVRRSGQRGSRRALYEVTSLTDARFLDMVLASYRSLADLLRSGKHATKDKVVHARLAETSEFFDSWVDQLDHYLRRWREERRRA